MVVNIITSISPAPSLDVGPHHLPMAPPNHTSSFAVTQKAKWRRGRTEKNVPTIPALPVPHTLSGRGLGG